MQKVDLHIHTNISDGLLSPEKVVLNAKNNGCNVIAITDHEIINDYCYLEKKYNIKIVSGIEFNTSESNLHILGYAIEDIVTMSDTMKALMIQNEIVCFEVIRKMQQDGFDISKEKIEEYLKQVGITFDIMTKRKIVKYLMYKGYSNSIIETYNRLIGKGQKYYVPNKKMSPQEIIKLIKMCGGVSVLAHPTTLALGFDDLYKIIERLKCYGLSGIEVINKKFKNEIFEKYQKIAMDLDLLETVGSDFHDPEIDNIGISVDEKIYTGIVKKIVKRKI